MRCGRPVILAGIWKARKHSQAGQGGAQRPRSGEGVPGPVRSARAPADRDGGLRQLVSPAGFACLRNHGPQEWGIAWLFEGGCVPGVEARWISSAVGDHIIITMGRRGHGRPLFRLWSSSLLPRGLKGAKAADQTCGCKTTGTASPRSTAKSRTSTIVPSPSRTALANASQKNLVCSGPTCARCPTIPELALM